MENSEAGLIEFLKEKARSSWDDAEQPYLLSMVSPDLKAEDIDYRSILGEERLKTFVKRTEGNNNYNMVEHPSQKAKVGVVPAGVQFTFVDNDEYQKTPIEDIRPQKNSITERERIVIDFLRILSKLPDKDLDGVIIPTRVLAKILGRR